MIDIHSHLLPAIDDGPCSMEEAVSMLALAAGDGITNVVATPHADLRYSFSRGQRDDVLRSFLALRRGGTAVCGGCEVHLTPDNVASVLSSPADYTLNGGDCVLLELPEAMAPPMVEPATGALSCGGLRVIIAHPERNPYIQRHPDYARKLVDAGCYLQLTASSITGSFGPQAETCAHLLLKRRLAHFVATDAHGAARRRPLLSAARRLVSDTYGETAARTLFVSNPRAALEGAPVREMSGRPSWFASLFGRTPSELSAPVAGVR